MIRSDTSMATDRPASRLDSIPSSPAAIASNHRRHFAIRGGRA
jgi:hypothetical protein